MAAAGGGREGAAVAELPHLVVVLDDGLLPLIERKNAPAAIARREGGVKGHLGNGYT